MKAELESGEIVTLEKDCECITHNGPHWVYADDLSRRVNIGGAPSTYLGALGVAGEEIARLDEKLRIFKQKGIVRLIREECDELTEVQRQRMLRHFRRVSAERAPKPAPELKEETRQEMRRKKEEVQLKARHSI